LRKFLLKLALAVGLGTALVWFTYPAKALTPLGMMVQMDRCPNVALLVQTPKALAAFDAWDKKQIDDQQLDEALGGKAGDFIKKCTGGRDA
jgi:hypothetical protein